MAAPETRKWKAELNLMPISPRPLRVTGEVKTTAGNLKPRLKMAKPQGINPAILILDLAIVDTGGPGTTDVTFRPARYAKPAKQGQYQEVNIRFDGKIIARAKVTESH